jgi:hypothetical protein
LGTAVFNKGRIVNEQNVNMPSSFLDRVVARQDELGLTDADIDKALGTSFGRLWRRIKKRAFPLALYQVPKLAVVLQLDRASLLRQAMQEMFPDLLHLVDEHLQPSQLSDREARLIKQFRKVTAGKEIGPVVYYEVATKKTLVIEGV